MSVSPIQKLYHKSQEDSMDTPKLLNSKIKEFAEYKNRLEP
jgi:hypothetical protein